MRFLASIEGAALDLAQQKGALVVAHSDHGLVATRHVPEIDRFLVALKEEDGCLMGGAGRTRWLYPSPGSEDRLLARLERGLPSTIRIASADEVFVKPSVARERVGAIVLIAGGDEFVTFNGQHFEHGSLTDAELDVPLAVWDF
jgi:hypothetical protein